MADIIYNNFKEYIGDNTIDMDGDTFKVMLLDDGHTPSAAHDAPADVSGDELANGNGYTTGGATLANVSWSETGGTATFDADDVEWSGATFSARYAVIYSDTASKLVCLLDFGSNQSPSAQTFRIAFHANGIFTLS